MRTTLELDDHLIAAAKRLAKEQGTTLGHVISRLARQSLVEKSPLKIRNGVPVFVPSPSSAKPDLSIVNKLTKREHSAVGRRSRRSL